MDIIKLTGTRIGQRCILDEGTWNKSVIVFNTQCYAGRSFATGKCISALARIIRSIIKLVIVIAYCLTWKI